MTRILFTGRAGSGSWIMRGEQLAATRRSWRAVADASARELRRVDVAVIVKAVTPQSLAVLRRWGGPIVYDALDFWHQPKSAWRRRSEAQRVRDPQTARTLFATHFQSIAPDLVVCATQAMADDLAPLGWKTDVLHHHFDPRLETAPPRSTGRRTVLYHGHPAYLRQWRGVATAACVGLGVRFMMSRETPPPGADVMLAVRGGRFGCWLARRWKSNVKGATAMRLGLPLAAWPEAGLTETCREAFWFSSPGGLVHALRLALSAPRPEPELERFSVEWAGHRLERIIERALGCEVVQ